MDRRARWVACLLLFGSCATPQSSMEASIDWSRLTAELPPPEVTDVEIDRAGRDCAALVTNHSLYPVRYFGYGPQHIFSQQEMWSDDQWEPVRVSWCGTGADWHWLPAGESVRLQLQFPKWKGPVRLLGTFVDPHERRVQVVLAERPREP